MRHNNLGQPVLQSDDDIAAEFFDRFPDAEGGLNARFIEHDDTFGWCCTVTDDEGEHEMSAMDFEDKEQLVAWLERQSVAILA